jgi:hypothetical protein
MIHTNPEIETSNLILDFEFDQHSGSHKHVINIIIWFRDMGCYNLTPLIRLILIMMKRAEKKMNTMSEASQRTP